MPLDPRAQRLLAMLALSNQAQALSNQAQALSTEAQALSNQANPAETGLDAAERRRSFTALMNLSRRAEVVASVTDGMVQGADGALPARCYTPMDAPDGPMPGLVFFHGGGLVAGDLDTHDAFCRSLAVVAACRVIAVAYRLAPEHRFPAAVDDAVAATTAILGDASAWGLDRARIGVAGDSAGATLATVVAAADSDTATPRLRLQVLLCPVLDLVVRRPSRLDFGQGYMLDQVTMDRDLAAYLPPGIDPADPRVSPLHRDDLAGLCPALIHTAAFDPLRDEGLAYAERLTAAGVPVRHTCHPGMIHHFVALTGLIPAAAIALSAIGAEIRAALAP
ncbi:alpha/beta hydrolase [Lichenihabitans sp. PAMC28606]|uniref:alpha/beta hydrolase n=1 Tax=Lichenihabitans sp. PAMC28606 TaxID=2880932 RepID=UPI001D0A1F62|nr:alpha/beta hydrolase [Lichenihabitans sp. PAMC28606]UDL93769.1 alpha/beta hydrolase [Lichenihabitans sp. PAMC28606]